MYCAIFCSYGLAFWYGAKLIVEDDYTVGKKLIVFTGVIIGASGVARFGKNVSIITEGQTSALSVFEIIDRKPSINKTNGEGKTVIPNQFSGKIEFKNVKFSYPSRKDHRILKGKIKIVFASLRIFIH